MTPATSPDLVQFTTGILHLNLSPYQETLLRAMDGLPLDDDQLAIYRKCTGRTIYHAGHRFPEVTCICGARAGKDSRVAGPFLLHQALFGQHVAGRGESLTIPLVAQDARATQIAYGYIREYLLSSEDLRGLIVGEPKVDMIGLVSGATIRCFPSTLASLRGWSIPVAVLDELAFFDDGADAEIQVSLRRGQLNFPGRRLLKISTPYMASGVLFDDYERAWGKDDPDLLVWVATSRDMNPGISEQMLEQQRRLDPQRYAREYEAQWTDDVSAFLPASAIDAAVVPGRLEIPPAMNRRYIAGVDVSGGRSDSFALSIVHLAPDADGSWRVVQDVALEIKPPVDIDVALDEIAETLHRYAIKRVHGDRYAAEFVVKAFKERRITYALPERPNLMTGDVSYMDASQAYVESYGWFVSEGVELLDHKGQTNQLRRLIRSKSPGGADKVTHPSSGHDDVANALCLAIALIGRGVVKPVAGRVPGSSTVERLGYPALHPGAVPMAGMPGRVRAYGAMAGGIRGMLR